MGGHSQKKAMLAAKQKKQERELANRKFMRYFWGSVAVVVVAIGVGAALIDKHHPKRVPMPNPPTGQAPFSAFPQQQTVSFSEAMRNFNAYQIITGKKYDFATDDRELKNIVNAVVMSLVGEMKAPQDDNTLAQFALLIKNSLNNDRFYPDLNALPDDYSFIKQHAQEIDLILLANGFKKISIDLASEYLKKYKQETDISFFLKQRLVYIGDRHGSYAVREEVIRLLPNFRNAGFTHIGLEFSSNDIEKEIDEDVARCKSNLEKLKPILANPSLSRKNRELLEQDKESNLRGIEHNAEMKSLLQTALKLGFKVVPIDTNVTVEGALEDMKGRDRFMASKISRVIANQQNKMLVFVGLSHIKKMRVPANVASITGVHGISIDINNEFRVQGDSDVTMPGTTMLGAIQKEGLEGKKFILPIYPKWGDFDYLYHIPQHRDDWVPTGAQMHQKLKTPQLGKINFNPWENMLTEQQEYVR